jgi:uncharacterized protein YneF (UPF0154 family)
VLFCNEGIYFTFQRTWETKSIPIQKTTNETKIKIENVTTSECTIKLWCNFTGKVQIIDNILVAPTTFTNYKTTVTPENKDGSRYLTSKITVNPTKLTTGNGIRHTTLRTKSENNTTVTDKTNDIVHKGEDDLTNNSALIMIIVSIVILCLLVTLVGTFYYFKRYHQKNSNDNNIDSTEKIQLMPVPSQEIVTNIKINFLESYLKKTMVSGRNFEDQFYVSGAPT